MKNLWGKEIIFPDDIFYSEELMWAKVEQERIRIGICHAAVRATKSLISIDMECQEGNRIDKGQRIGTVETSKVLWEIISPVSGEVVAINGEIAKGNARPIMNDAYGDGWLLELNKVSETGGEIDELHKGDAAETKEWLAEYVEEMVPLLEED